jgi:hypothetical protein
VCDENYILYLCGKAVAANDEEAAAILAELQSALREHTRQARRIMQASYPQDPLDLPDAS